MDFHSFPRVFLHGIEVFWWLIRFSSRRLIGMLLSGMGLLGYLYGKVRIWLNGDQKGWWSLRKTRRGWCGRRMRFGTRIRVSFEPGSLATSLIYTNDYFQANTSSTGHRDLYELPTHFILPSRRGTEELTITSTVRHQRPQPRRRPQRIHNALRLHLRLQ